MQKLLIKGKKKISGKESFVVKFNNLPNEEEIENHMMLNL